MASMSLRTLGQWVVFPLLNAFFWYYISHARSLRSPCPIPAVAVAAATTATPTVYCDEAAETAATHHHRRNLLAVTTTTATTTTTGSRHDRCTPPAVDERFLTSPNVRRMKTSDIDRFRVAQLADMLHPDSLKGGQSGFMDDTYLVGSGPHRNGAGETPCTQLKWTVRDAREDSKCLAVAYVHGSFGALTHGPLRFDADVDEHNLRLSTFERLFGEHGEYKKKKPKLHEQLFVGNVHNRGHVRPVGLFRKVPKERGHARVVEKLGAFVRHYDGPNGIRAQLAELLARRGVRAGMDVVAMAINEGEIDLFLNFACSCRLHNISTSNVLVFAGSREIVTMIESTGAMGIYHKGYSAVSKKPSTDYLDRPFVDMMWYKAFSIYLVLQMKVNVLFQDVDLVWFRDPFSVFHSWTGKATGDGRGPFVPLSPPDKPIEAYFSDDAQRSLRYSPFYANSGFYYLRATPRTEYFAWSIMTIYDAVQALGSHQNVLTTRLVEGLALSAERTVILPLNAFPGGVHYHHDHAYMRRLERKQEHPYVFHMCWTQGKPDKLVYLRKAHMWYLKDACSPLEYLKPDGHVFGLVLEREEGGHDGAQRWDLLSRTCCQFQDSKSP
jgi:hypothetical protein